MPQNYNHDASPSIWFGRDRNGDRSLDEYRTSRPSYGMDFPGLMHPSVHPQWIFPPPQHWSGHFATATPTHEIELDMEHSSGYNHAIREGSGSPPQAGAPPVRRMPYQRPSRIPDFGSQQRRQMLRPFGGSASFPELTPLPRSNRRSFDRSSNEVHSDVVATNSLASLQWSRAAGRPTSAAPRTMCWEIVGL